MKETGIIMSGNHPVDIIDGRKTMTRRVIKPQPWEMDKVYFKDFKRDYGGRKCPYGQVGDRLWVRETWAVSFAWEGTTASYDASLKPILKEISGRLDKMDGYRYHNHQKRFLRMVPKTERLLENAEAAIARRGAEVLAVWLELLKQRYAQVSR